MTIPRLWHDMILGTQDPPISICKAVPLPVARAASQTAGRERGA